MADQKKSIVLYTDLLHTFEELSNEEAGVLIKHIFRYVNDLNPDSPDKLTKIAFEPIKQQLKRDLQKWEVTRGERVDAGKAGGIKSGESRRLKAELKKQKEANEALALKLKQKEANEAVSVNAIVNATVPVKEIDDVVKTPPTSAVFFTIHDFEKYVDFSSDEFAMYAVRRTEKSLAELEVLRAIFISDQKALTKVTWKDVTDAKHHFINWAMKQQTKSSKSTFVH